MHRNLLLILALTVSFQAIPASAGVYEDILAAAEKWIFQTWWNCWPNNHNFA
jgi:hypothetical protein